MREPPTRPRRLGATLALTVALASTTPAITAVVAPSPAYAGAWAQETCTNTANLQPAPIEGWVSNLGGGLATQGCNPYAGGLIAALGDASPITAGAGASWTYTAPAGSTIAGGEITYELYAPQGLTYISTPDASYDPADVLAVCREGIACGGTVGGSQSGTVAITHPGGTHIYEEAACYGAGGGDCTADGGGAGLDAQAQIFAATIDLTNNATPAASGFGGALLASGSVSGTEPIAFTATDPGGPGVYTVSIAIDGQNVYSGTPDTNSGECVSAGTDPSGELEFLNAQPCKTSVSVSVPVDTTSLADGQHNLTVTVTDAAGNSSTVLQQPITTANHTTVSAGLNSSPPPPPAASAGTPAPSPVYSIALDPATESLVRGVKRGWSKSALTFSGTLRNSSGVPAPGVPVTLTAQNGGTDALQVIARTTSNAAGQWTLTAPRGPTRQFDITDGAAAQPASPQSSVAISETVTPELSLTDKAIGHGRLRFTGKLYVNPLDSPRPQVVIEVANGKHWQSVGDPVTVSISGHYTLKYNGGSSAIGGHYSFRAVSAATNLFTAATSATRKVVDR